MSSTICKIHPPTSTEPFGIFNNIAYVRHQGQCSGSTKTGSFDVPYEFITPAKPTEGNRVFLFEPFHFSSGPVTRKVYLGTEFLFNRGFSSCSVGYSNLRLRIVNRTPRFTPKINGEPIVVVENPGPGVVSDTDILGEFASALKASPLPFLGPISRTYAYGFSDSGKPVHRIYEPFGHKLFDLTFTGTATYIKPFKFGQNPIIVFNSERDFDYRAVPDPKFPQYRWYAVAGAPHIPDSPLARPGFKSDETPPIAGTSPIDWSPIIRALFVAGDQWVRNGTPPPPSVKLRVNPKGVIARDVRGNALGGIRHPALENGGEATFIASIVKPNPDTRFWELFGGYSTPKELEDSQFLDYLTSFKAAAEALVTARYLLPAGGQQLIEQAQLELPNTFTRNYMNGLFPRGENSTN